MRIAFYGRSFDLSFEQNIPLVAETVERVTHEAAQDASPAGDLPPQATDLIVHVRTAAA